MTTYQDLTRYMHILCIYNPLCDMYHIYTYHQQLSYWVSSEICTFDDAKVRGQIIEKFIEVAKVRYKNFRAPV